MRPWLAPCQLLNRSLMRCMPSSRSLAENLGATLLASPSGDIGPATFSLSRTDSANTQRRPVRANAAAERLMPPTFSTIVVVPVRIASNAATVTISDASSPWSRLLGCDGEARGVGEAEVFVEAAREHRAHVGMAVDQAREKRLAASVVDVGARMRLEDLVGRTDRRDPVAFHRQRHVVCVPHRR